MQISVFISKVLHPIFHTTKLQGQGWIVPAAQLCKSVCVQYQNINKQQSHYSQIVSLPNLYTSCTKMSAAEPQKSDSPLLKRIHGTIYGNCIGDAIGLMTEFMNKEEAKAYYGKYPELEYGQKYNDAHRSRWRNGDWTDDSDQMILMIDSILEKKMVDPCDYGQKVLYWARHGFPELGDYGGMGLGATTHYVLKHTLFKSNPHKAAEEIWETTQHQAAPNGAVMRTSLMGIYEYGDLDKVAKNSIDFCKVTHADYRCQASCIAVTRAIALMLQGKHMKSEHEFDVKAIITDCYKFAKTHIKENMSSNYGDKKKFTKELKAHMFADNLKDLKLDEPRKIGYTYKTLGAGFWALKQADFRKALQAIVMEAGDADTNGAVAGALLGCKLGVEGLPDSWLNGLVHKDWLDDRINRFLNEAMKITIDQKENPSDGPEAMQLGGDTVSHNEEHLHKDVKPDDVRRGSPEADKDNSEITKTAGTPAATTEDKTATAIGKPGNDTEESVNPGGGKESLKEMPKATGTPAANTGDGTGTDIAKTGDKTEENVDPVPDINGIEKSVPTSAAAANTEVGAGKTPLSNPEDEQVESAKPETDEANLEMSKPNHTSAVNTEDGARITPVSNPEVDIEKGAKPGTDKK